MERVRQNILPVLTAFIWGTAFVSQDLASRHLGAFSVNMARSFIAAAFLLLVSLGMGFWQKRKRQPEADVDAETPEERSKNRRQLWVGGVCCGSVLAAAVVLQQAGIARSGAGKAGFLTALYVVLVPILGLLQKKKAPRRVWAAAVFAVFGLYLLCVPRGSRFSVSVGDWLLMGCALAFSVQIMLVDRLAPHVDNIKLSCIQFAVCGVFSLLGTVLFEHPQAADFTACIWPILYCGIFASGVAYTLQIISQKGANPAVVSILLSLESVFATLSAAVYLHEILSVREYAGCALMLLAVILSQLPVRRSTDDTAADSHEPSHELSHESSPGTPPELSPETSSETSSETSN